MITEHILTTRYLLHIRIDDRLGKIMRLDIRSAPIILIPITTVTAVSTARNPIYNPALVPVALAKFSSNVTANILLKNTIKSKTTMIESIRLTSASSSLRESMLPNI